MKKRSAVGSTMGGPLLVLLGSALWSTNAPFFKILQVDSFLAIFIRASIAGLLLLPCLRPHRIRWDRYLLTMLLSYTALCVSIVLAIRSTSANIATGMQYTAPVWIYLLSWRRGRPLFSLQRNWPLLLLLAGLVVSMCSGSSAVTLKGNLLALSTSLFFTAMTISSKHAAADNPLGMVSLSNLFCATVVGVLFVPHPVETYLQAITPQEWLILLFLGAFQIAGGYALYYIGLRTTEPAHASMLAPCEMVLGTLWVAIFLREFPDWIGILGSLFIVIGVVGQVIVTQKLPPLDASDSSSPAPARENAALSANTSPPN